MPKIKFSKDQNVIEVPQGSNLRQSLLDAGKPVASSCGGEGVCGKCWVKVMEGDNILAPPNEIEQFLKTQNNLGPIYRISCQVIVTGDIAIDAPYW